MTTQNTVRAFPPEPVGALARQGPSPFPVSAQVPSQAWLDRQSTERLETCLAGLPADSPRAQALQAELSARAPSGPLEGDYVLALLVPDDTEETIRYGGCP